MFIVSNQSLRPYISLATHTDCSLIPSFLMYMYIHISNYWELNDIVKVPDFLSCQDFLWPFWHGVFDKIKGYWHLSWNYPPSGRYNHIAWNSITIHKSISQCIMFEFIYKVYFPNPFTVTVSGSDGLHNYYNLSQRYYCHRFMTSPSAETLLNQTIYIK